VFQIRVVLEKLQLSGKFDFPNLLLEARTSEWGSCLFAFLPYISGNHCFLNWRRRSLWMLSGCWSFFKEIAFNKHALRLGPALHNTYLLHLRCQVQGASIVLNLTGTCTWPHPFEICHSSGADHSKNGTTVEGLICCQPHH